MDTFDQLNYGLQPKRAKWFRLLKTVDRDVVQAVEILLLLLLLLLTLLLLSLSIIIMITIIISNQIIIKLDKKDHLQGKFFDL